MVRIAKIISKIIGVGLLLILLAWMGIAIYINFHKKELLTAITNQLNESINGTLTVESMEPTLVKGFPAISVSLANVLLRDTQYYKHHHDLLKAKKVSITVDALSVLNNAPRIRKINIEDGTVYLFTDSNGYSNTNIFLKESVRDSSGKMPPPKLNHFVFDNIHFVFEHKSNKKLFDFDITHLEGKFNYADTGWQATMNVAMLVRALDFYNPNGPFLKNKKIEGTLHANYNALKQILDIPERRMHIGSSDITIGGRVLLAQHPVLFSVDIKAKDIDFEAGRSMLSTHIQEKVGKVHLSEPFDIQVSVHGKDEKRDQPVVYARWQVANNTLEGQGAVISNCNFKGYFHNQVNPAMKVCDENSVIALETFSGVWEGINFTANDVRIDDLISPVLAAHFQSAFSLATLNPILENRTFKMEKGEVNVDLKFRGGIKNNETVQPYITGTVRLKDAAITYLPRQMKFTNTNAQLQFNGSDLLVTKVKLQNGSNVLNMEGTMKNLLNFYYTDPSKILLYWHIRSGQINLNEYKNFLAARANTSVPAASASKKQAKSVSRFSGQLDQVLEQSSVQMRMDVDKISYQKFSASNIVAVVNMNNAGINLQKVKLQHAGGTLELDAQINQNGSTNQFAVNAKVTRVKIDDFLTAFGNFGQNTLTEKNIKGDIYLQANVTGSIRDNGVLTPGSMKGTAQFDLKNASLINFEPLKNVGKYVFRRRDFSNIRITSLSNKLEIDGDKIRILPLQLSSDAINADIEGIYSLGKGTDINVDIPLRNPKKDDLVLDEELKQERRNNGIVIHLNVSDNEDGKMKIRLRGKAAKKRP